MSNAILEATRKNALAYARKSGRQQGYINVACWRIEGALALIESRKPSLAYDELKALLDMLKKAEAEQ